MSRSSSVFSIQGRELTFPIEIRHAESHAALFLADLRATQAMIAATGLRAQPVLPGKALVTIPFVRYLDGDLETYNEVGVAVLVRGVRGAERAPASGPPVRKGPGVYIHQLPVDQTFTLEAGRTLWGFPKFLADITIQAGGGASAASGPPDQMARCELRHDGRHVLTLTMKEGGPLPAPRRMPPSFSFMDGVLRKTTWTASGAGRMRFGGVRLELGDHPISDELRALRLRPVACQTVPHMRASFGPAEVVRPR